MAKATRATLHLDKVGVAYLLHPYDYRDDAGSKGLQAADALGAPPHRVLKTLMARVDGQPVCAIVPSDAKVSTKKLAAVFAGKSAEMMATADAERISGYKVGGISPFAQQRTVPTVIEASVMDAPSVWINAGQRGLLVELAPQAVCTAIEGLRSADVIA